MDRPSFIERIIVIANYITCGLVGFVWLILNAIRGGRLTPFLQYHIFQSFFIVMLYWLIGTFTNLLVQILSFIPFVNMLVLKLSFYFNTPFIFGYSIVSGTIVLIIAYLVLTSLQGQYSYLPWVSDIIKRMVR
ncbi:MAG: hypothetical protein K6E29_06330 [Cyanobacteria bacterium RUI128]|nr:hypothetical protein [Cyanobacteria bacterium RUI128]